MNTVVLERIQPTAAAASRLSDDIVIGKDILELLTGAMYVDPLTVFREYVQNSVDSIEDGLEQGLYSGEVTPAIAITLDPKTRSIRIRDNGPGIRKADFVRRLTTIGASLKRGTPRRGFRGVGRLSGLGYCQELVFRSRGFGEREVSELIWNGRQLRELLRSADDSTQLNDSVKAIVGHRTRAPSDEPAHFFEVEMRQVTRLKNDPLLAADVVALYLAQTAPVTFDPGFAFGKQIATFLGGHGISTVCPLSINGKQIFKPHADVFEIRAGKSGSFTTAETFEIPDPDGNVAAVGWLLHHGYEGSLPRGSGLGGLRLRVKNVQVGTPDLIAPLFKEARLNDWCVGEIHVLSSKLIPNGRRDDFEATIQYQHFQAHLSVWCKKLTKLCRETSAGRARSARVRTLMDSVSRDIEGLVLWSTLRPVPAKLVRNAARGVAKLERIAADQPQLRRRLEAARQALSRLKVRPTSKDPKQADLAYALLQAVQRQLPKGADARPMIKRVLEAVFR